MWDKVIMMLVTLGVTHLEDSSAEPLSGNSKWQRPGILTQDYNSFLIGIEQRLRGIDSIRHSISHTEISIQSVSNRMDLMETRLQTIQNSFQHTLDAVSTAVKSSEMKYELLLEQLSRKMEASFDRLNHRLNTMESRSESMITKLQNQIDQQFGRVDTKLTSMGNDVVRVGSNVDLIRGQLTRQEERSNHTFLTISNHFKEVHSEHGIKKEHLNNITMLLKDLHSNRSESHTQSDAPMLPEEGLKIIRSEISIEGHKLSSKINNMYNDLWKTVKDLEVQIKSGFEDTNITNRELYSNFSVALIEEQRNSENFMDLVMGSVLTNVRNHLNGLQRQVDNKFKEFKTSQDRHGEACHKIKNVVENRVALILEKIYDTFINRTDRFSRQVVDVAELLKAHNKQLIQSTTETSSLLVTLAEESSQEHKRLDNSITDASECSQYLQIQIQEMSDLFKKHQVTAREVKSLLLLLKEKQLFNSSSLFENEKLHAVEANYSNGVINIKTNPMNADSELEKTQEENGQKSGIPLETLNKSISTTELVAVIGESRSNYDGDEDESTKRYDERDNDDGFDTEEETGIDDEKPVDLTQLLLAYIKLLHGHLTPQEFLAEAVPGSSYESFDDMIKNLRKASNVPRETIHDIEQLAQEQNYKDSTQTDREIGRIIKLLRRNSDIENEDDNYEDDE